MSTETISRETYLAAVNRIEKLEAMLKRIVCRDCAFVSEEARVPFASHIEAVVTFREARELVS